MHRIGATGTYPGAVVGSLLDDIGPIARRIYATLVDDEVRVWTTPQLEIYFMQAQVAPEISAEFLLGTYGMGASVEDIEEDLVELRESRLAGAIVF